MAERDCLTVQELIRTADHDAVLHALVRLELCDANEVPEYDRALQMVVETEPSETSTISSVVVTILHEDDGRTFGDVSGICPGDDQKVAIEYCPWGEWLSATVVRGSGAENLSNEEMLAHIIWEMTWISFDPNEIAKRLDKLVKSVERLT